MGNTEQVKGFWAMHAGVVVASLASLRWWHLCDHLKEVREWVVCVSGRKAFPGRRNGQCKGPEGRNLLCLRKNKGLCGWRWVSVEYLKVMRSTWEEQVRTEGTAQFWKYYTWTTQGQSLAFGFQASQPFLFCHIHWPGNKRVQHTNLKGCRRSFSFTWTESLATT